LPHGLSSTESALWMSLHPSDGLTPDELSRQTSMPVSQVAAGLLTLEMQRLAKQLPGKRYVRQE
jgi:predicted Rossmann fold nucleotide-binding protein DprA/Smf involved in DNA uptake